MCVGALSVFSTAHYRPHSLPRPVPTFPRRHPVPVHGQGARRGWRDCGVQHRGKVRQSYISPFAIRHARHHSSPSIPCATHLPITTREIPIVHRAIKAHTEVGSAMQRVLTKGDNNYGDDRVLYAPGQEWLHREHIMGRAVGYLPHVGRVTIIMNDYPYVKYLLIGVLGLLVVTSKE